MNILLLIRSIGKGIGGVEIVTINLANEFISQGHQVSIFVFTKGNVDVLNRLNKRVKLHVGYGYENSKENFNYLQEILINYQIDIIVNQWGLPYLPIKVINRARKGLDIKVVSVYHNDPSTNGRLKDIEISLSDTSNPFKRLISKMKWQMWKYITSHSMRYVYNHSDRYMVLSPCYVEHFKRFTGIKNPEKLLVQTNPVTLDASGFVFETSGKKKEILYVGRIDYSQKRVYRVIDTWALLEKHFPDWKLTIVGDGPERKNIEKQVQVLNLQRVSFEGFQQPIEYYKRASLLMLTSDFEGFPLVLAECMSFGVVPAVYGSYAAVYDIIEDGKDGLILPFDKKAGYDAQKMAERMAAVMDTPETLKTMAVQAVEKSKEYSIDKIVGQWEEVMKRL